MPHEPRETMPTYIITDLKIEDICESSYMTESPKGSAIYGRS